MEWNPSKMESTLFGFFFFFVNLYIRQVRDATDQALMQNSNVKKTPPVALPRFNHVSLVAMQVEELFSS